MYAFRGDGNKTFLRYDVGAGTWSQLTDTPASVEEGGALAWIGGDFIYALRGDKSTNFWRYSISGNSWENLAATPEKVDKGGAMVFLNGVLYALRGDNNEDFWRYEPLDETATETRASLPAKCVARPTRVGTRTENPVAGVPSRYGRTHSAHIRPDDRVSEVGKHVHCATRDPLFNR